MKFPLPIARPESLRTVFGVACGVAVPFIEGFVHKADCFFIVQKRTFRKRITLVPPPLLTRENEHRPSKFVEALESVSRRALVTAFRGQRPPACPLGGRAEIINCRRRSVIVGEGL